MVWNIYQTYIDLANRMVRVEIQQYIPKDEELSQAWARVIISAVLVIGLSVYAYWQNLENSTIPIIFGYWTFAVAWWVFVKLKPNQYLFRRYIPIFTDIGIISFGMFNMGEFGAFVYPLYLWVIVGNGIRFGQKPLFVALTLAVISFSSLLVSTDYWLSNKSVGAGLLIGIVILPLFYAGLIRRLHTLNRQLLIELDRSHYAATHDGMTSLLNRNSFVQKLEEEIRRSKRYGQLFSVFYIDLDNFKYINDNYGHLQGDDVIVTIASRLKSSIRSTDMAARMGGDEFALILLSMNNEEDIDRFANKLLTIILEPIDICGYQFKPSASLGASRFPASGDSVELLIRAADAAMYISKSKGKNSFTLDVTKEK